MRWSRSLRSRTSAAVRSRLVSATSSGLGTGSPEGWLCATRTAIVPGVTHAGTNTSGIEIRAASRVPRDTTCHASRRCLADRHATPKVSTGISRRPYRLPVQLSVCLYKGPGDYGAKMIAQPLDTFRPTSSDALGIVDIGAMTDP